MTCEDPARRVLVGSTDRDLRELITTALEGAGFSVDVIANGRDLVSRALVRVPRLVVLESTLLGISGSEVLKNLRALESTSDVRAIVLVATSTEVRFFSSLRPSTDLLLQKPFSLDSLLHAVEEATDRQAGVVSAPTE